MAEQFENANATKLEDETESDSLPQKKLDHIAEKAAEKASKTEQRYDEEHTIFSK
jgi:hypothetical protein